MALLYGHCPAVIPWVTPETCDEIARKFMNS